MRPRRQSRSGTVFDWNIEFSENSFVNDDGKHLPLFCTVTINLDFWITPSPDLQFMSMLGHEMFGRDG